MGNQNAKFAVKCTYGVLLADIALFLEQLPVSRSPPAQQESFLAIMDQIQRAYVAGPPDALAVQRIQKSGCSNYFDNLKELSCF